MTRGRPKGSTKAFLQDGDRYAIALADTLHHYGFSQRTAFDMAAVLAYGQPAAPTKLPRNAQDCAGFGLFGFEMKRPGDGVASRSSRLLKKAKRAVSEDDMYWRTTMKTAMGLAMFVSKIGGNQKRDMVLTLCSSIGEEQFGDVCLGPLCRYSPDLN